jgi:hypothetical protein
MILSETMFIEGRPIGKILTDAQTGSASFIPFDNRDTRLPNRQFANVTDCRKAVASAYRSGGNE